MLEKARTLACDVVVLDLEDAVAPEHKDEAREAACAALRGFGDREVVVRINARGTPWFDTDLAAVTAAKPDAILLPKVDGPEDIVTSDVPVWAMIETPKAVLNLAAIAASGVTALCLGANDLMKAMHARAMPDRRNLCSVMTDTVIAARAHGLTAIDATYNAIGDEAGLAESCAQGRSFGFDGKTLIHPSQIEACNRAFAPSDDEIAQARAVLDIFLKNPGKGAIALDGRMVERLHADEAERLLKLADAIKARA
jgi:citrate lyase subunit beta/citryl-CoA lyase